MVVICDSEANLRIMWRKPQIPAVSRRRGTSRWPTGLWGVPIRVPCTIEYNLQSRWTAIQLNHNSASPLTFHAHLDISRDGHKGLDPLSKLVSATINRSFSVKVEPNSTYLLTFVRAHVIHTCVFRYGRTYVPMYYIDDSEYPYFSIPGTRVAALDLSGIPGTCDGWINNIILF